MDTATAEPPVTLTIATLPPLGAALAGGLFAGLTTRQDGAHCAVVLLPDRPAKLLGWKAAMAWAKKLDAELPSRPVGALLYANAKDQFDTDPSWHWTCEELHGSYAWTQHFGNGTQYDDHKGYEGRARAVRLIQLSA